jgi:hypothetical protein
LNRGSNPAPELPDRPESLSPPPPPQPACPESAKFRRLRIGDREIRPTRTPSSLSGILPVSLSPPRPGVSRLRRTRRNSLLFPQRQSFFAAGCAG